MKFAWENTVSTEARASSKEASAQFMNASKLYLHTEYQKAYAKASDPFKEVKALSSMGGSIGSLVVNKISDYVASEYEEFGCLNSKAKSTMLCGIIGDIFLPPAGVVALLKYGKGAVKDFPKLTRIFDLVKKTGPLSYADVLKKYPKLRFSLKNLERDIPAGKLITHPRQIKFSPSNEFRPVKDQEMKIRAEQLEPQMSESITGAYNALNDTPGLEKYFKELHRQTVERMIEKGRPEDLELLKEGMISRQAMHVVLVKRLKERGDNQFTAIVPNKKTGKVDLKYKGEALSNEDLTRDADKFRAAVKSGSFFDRAFNDENRYGHGVFTHIVQRDIVSQAVSQATKGNPQEFWNYLGSKKGINWWADLFDSGNAQTFNRPEVLTEFLGHKLNAN